MGSGLYLASAVDAYNRARVLEEASSQRAGHEAAQAFQIDQYLKDLEKENEAQSILTDVLRQRQQPPMGAPGMAPGMPQGMPAIPPPPPGMPPGVPPGPIAATPPGAPMAPSGPPATPEMGQQPMPAPMGPTMPSPTTMPGARPPVMDAIMGGLRPEQQARFLTSRTGRQVLPALEESERERRHIEDKQKAEEAFGQAKTALAENDPAGWADYMAKGYRYLGEGQNAARMMEHAAKVRTDKVEMEQAPKDFEAILGAVKKWESDPTPENLQGVTTAMSEAKSTTAKMLSREMMLSKIRHGLDRDPEKQAMLTHFIQATGLRGVKPLQAWQEVVQKFPAGAAKVWAEALMSPDKVHMPAEFYEALRVSPPMPTKDPTVGQRAIVLATERAAKLGMQPNLADPGFMRLVEEERNKLVKAEAAAKRDPNADEILNLRKQIYEKRLKAMDNPDGLSDKEIRLQLANITTQLKAHESGAIELAPEDLAQLKESQRFYIDLQSQRRAEQGGKGTADVAKDAKRAQAMAVVKKLYPGRTWDQLTPAEKQKVADQVK